MRTLLLTAALLAMVPQTQAGPFDWPSWRGPERTGVSAETGLLREWPKEGPKLLWTAKGLGGGYAAPSIAGGRVFLLGSKGEEEFLICLGEKDGKEVWRVKLGIVGENRGPNYPGPRSTPTVDGERVYALGSDGDLVCCGVEGGKEVWRKHLERDYDGNRGTWAYAEAPLIDGDRLVCTPGGPQATMLVLDKKSGKEIWKCAITEGGNQVGYASVMVAEGAGVRQYVQFLGSGVIGVSAADGKLLWRYTKNVGGVSAVTPVVHDGCIFVTSSAADRSGAGGDALLRLTNKDGKPGVEEVYFKKSLRTFHGGVVRLGEFVYGTDGAGLVCLELKTGEPKWRHRSIGKGSLISADGLLLLRNERGTVALVEAKPDGYSEKGRFEQPDRSRFATFTHPALANGCLYLRDENVLHCYSVKKP